MSQRIGMLSRFCSIIKDTKLHVILLVTQPCRILLTYIFVICIVYNLVVIIYTRELANTISEVYK